VFKDAIFCNTVLIVNIGFVVLLKVFAGIVEKETTVLNGEDVETNPDGITLKLGFAVPAGPTGP